MVSFKIISSCCQLKSHATSYSLPKRQYARVCMLFKHDVQFTFLDSNCVEMGVKAVGRDQEVRKLLNDIRLVSIERVHNELFTSEQRMLTSSSL